jgi:hypothetical protein
MSCILLYSKSPTSHPVNISSRNYDPAAIFLFTSWTLSVWWMEWLTQEQRNRKVNKKRDLFPIDSSIHQPWIPLPWRFSITKPPWSNREFYRCNCAVFCLSANRDNFKDRLISVPGRQMSHTDDFQAKFPPTETLRFRQGFRRIICAFSMP